jgi:hypothetical protein
MATAELSVIIASQGAAEQTARCLESLLCQNETTADQLELIVAEGPPHSACGQLENRFHQVKFVRAKGTSIPILHGAGIMASSADLVAVTEGHCTFPQEWVGAAMKAHRSSTASVIGGCLELGGQCDGLNTALFLCDYAQFVPPISAGETTDLPGNNIVFKRSCLGDTTSFAQHGFWKTFFCHKLAKEGHELIANESLRVQYNRRLSPAEIIMRRYNHGRCFGAMRAAQWTAGRRLLFVLSGPLIAPLLMYKLAGRCSTNRQCRSTLVHSAPYAVACLWLWALGEWMGNLFGAGTSCDRL